MEWMLSGLNWWAIIGATVSTFVVGGLWYSEQLFGKQWGKLVGMTVKEMNNPEGMGKRYGMAGVASFITAVVLANLLLATGTVGWSDGLIFGAVIGFAFRMGAHVIHNSFAKKNETLTWIDGAHDIVTLAVMGAILANWL